MYLSSLWFFFWCKFGLAYCLALSKRDTDWEENGLCMPRKQEEDVFCFIHWRAVWHWSLWVTWLCHCDEKGESLFSGLTPVILTMEKLYFFFADGSQGELQASGGFGGMFDDSSQSQDDRGSVNSLFSSSSLSKDPAQTNQSGGLSQSQDASKKKAQSENDDMDEILGLCSGTFPASNTYDAHFFFFLFCFVFLFTIHICWDHVKWSNA